MSQPSKNQKQTTTRIFVDDLKKLQQSRLDYVLKIKRIVSLPEFLSDIIKAGLKQLKL